MYKVRSTNVACEAIVNPNGNVFKRYTDESFLYGQCEDCGTYPELTDPDEVKMDIDRLYQEFKSYSDTEPDYANCRIVYKDDGNEHDIKISLKVDDKSAAMEESIFYYCDCLSDFKSLADMAVRISYWSDATDSANGQKKNVFQIINKCL